MKRNTGGRYKVDGYWLLRQPDGSVKREHRLVIEEHLGRPLTTNEVVHHRNGDKGDNRISNLQVLSPGEHTRIHGVPRALESRKRHLERPPIRLASDALEDRVAYRVACDRRRGQDYLAERYVR